MSKKKTYDYNANKNSLKGIKDSDDIKTSGEVLQAIADTANKNTKTGFTVVNPPTTTSGFSKSKKTMIFEPIEQDTMKELSKSFFDLFNKKEQYTVQNDYLEFVPYVNAGTEDITCFTVSSASNPNVVVEIGEDYTKVFLGDKDKTYSLTEEDYIFLMTNILEYVKKYIAAEAA